MAAALSVSMATNAAGGVRSASAARRCTGASVAAAEPPACGGARGIHLKPPGRSAQQLCRSSSHAAVRGAIGVRRSAGRDVGVHAVADPTDAMHVDDAAPGARAEEEQRVGVMLLNLGGPEKLDDVQPFLYNLFADPDIIRLPAALQFLQAPLAALLSNSRAPKSREAYESIGGGSPLRRITDEQAQAIKAALAERGQAAEVYVGMRYWKPFTEDAVEQIKADKITRLVVLPLYPQFSISTSGSSLRLLEQIFSEDEYLGNIDHTVIPSWYERPGYVQAMAELIKAELEKPNSEFDAADEPIIFFSAHGVPVSYVEDAGDPYKEEMEECVQLIVDRLRAMGVNNEHVLAYQSRVGPVEWLKPYTDDVIRELGAKDTKAMVAVPISFVSEHIETLEEIDMEYRELAEESGVKQWGRVPALDTNPVFIEDLADAVVESLRTFDAKPDEGWEAAGALGSGDFNGRTKSTGSVGLPPVAVMPIGTGTRSGTGISDLLGVEIEPWRLGPLEFSMFAFCILLSALLMMDPQP